MGNVINSRDFYDVSVDVILHMWCGKNDRENSNNNGYDDDGAGMNKYNIASPRIFYSFA